MQRKTGKSGSWLRGVGSWLIDVVCGFLAYIGARLVWSNREVFDGLHWQLLTFAAIYLLLQAIVRGHRLARAGRAS